MWNVVIGLFMIVGGASGQLVLIGTDSSMALIGLGVLLAGYGGYQMVSSAGSAPSE